MKHVANRQHNSMFVAHGVSLVGSRWAELFAPIPHIDTELQRTDRVWAATDSRWAKFDSRLSAYIKQIEGKHLKSNKYKIQGKLTKNSNLCKGLEAGDMEGYGMHMHN